MRLGGPISKNGVPNISTDKVVVAVKQNLWVMCCTKGEKENEYA